MAHISLCSQVDSSALFTTVTNEKGGFDIDPSSIVTMIPKEESFIEVSFIGYKKRRIEVQDFFNLDSIRMQPDENLLKGVSIRANIYNYTPEGIIAYVQNSTLSKLGTAEDILEQLPLVSITSDGDYSVFAKGSAVIYLNNRKLQDNKELKRIKSSDIKSIQVITNPGAEYDATIEAVIRITTIKPIGQGLSGGLLLLTKINNQIANTDQIDFNYRKKDLDIFASITYINTRLKYDQYSQQIYDNRRLEENVDIHVSMNHLNSVIGFDNILNDNHAFGVRYQTLIEPQEEMANIKTNIEMFKDKSESNHFLGKDNQWAQMSNHNVNGYYHLKIDDKQYLCLDVDCVKGSEDNYQDVNDQIKKSIQTRSLRNYTFYAGKVVYEATCHIGKIKVGGEYAHTENEQEFNIENCTLETILSSNRNEARQNLCSGFFSYENHYGAFTTKMGFRFDEAVFEYYADGRRDYNASKKYRGFFPSASFGYQKDKLLLFLNYRRSTERPNYSSLRNNFSYNNPYSYEGGNPKLQPSNSHILEATFSWKDLTVSIDFKSKKKFLWVTLERYADSDSVILFQSHNTGTYNNVSVNVNYAKQIGFWHPEWEFSISKPYLKYKGKKYNDPMTDFGFNNTFHISTGWLIGCNLDYCTDGHSYYYKLYNALFVKMYVSKAFYKNHLMVNLQLTNALNTSKDKRYMSMNDIYFFKETQKNRPTLQVVVTYKFNSTRSKYQGETASEEKNRL